MVVFEVDDADWSVESVCDDVCGDPVEEFDGVVVPVGEFDELVFCGGLRALVLVLGWLGRGEGGRLRGRLGGLRRRLRDGGRGLLGNGGRLLSASAGEGQARYQNNGGCDGGGGHRYHLVFAGLCHSQG